jgi:hypothetical protein
MRTPDFEFSSFTTRSEQAHEFDLQEIKTHCHGGTQVATKLHQQLPLFLPFSKQPP